MPDHQQPAQVRLMQAAVDLAMHGVAVVPAHWPTEPAGLPGGLLACSCGKHNCPTQAQHLLPAVTSADATVNPVRVTRWWTTYPTANLATPAGISLDVIDYLADGPVDDIAAWLGERIDLGPVIVAGDRLLRFLVRGHAYARSTPPPSEAGSIRRLHPGAVVLLPPSQLIDGSELTWLRPFNDRTALLTDAGQLLDALAQLPSAEQLVRWGRDRTRRGDTSASAAKKW